MQYIKISELKKQAKKERKNNPSLKNHSDSLNYIAKKNNFDTWENLLNNSVILINNETSNFIDLSNTIIDSILDKINNFYNIFESKNSEFIANYIHNNFISNIGENNLWNNRSFELLKVISYIYCKTSNQVNIKHFHSLLNRENLFYLIEENFDEFMKENIIQNFIENICIDYKKPTIGNKHPEQSSVFIKQHGYLTMNYSTGFIDIDDLFVNLFKKKVNKNEIIKLLMDKNNILTCSTSKLFNKNKIFDEYNRQLTGNNSLSFNEDFFKKHTESLLKIQKSI